MTTSMTATPDVTTTSNRSLRWALRGMVVLPFLIAASRALATGWFPVGDSALLSVRAYDVGTSHHPLLGSWTSASLTLGVDVNNPGPLYPDLLAPFMWTIGRWFGIGAAVAVGVATLNAGFALATGWAGAQIGGWRVERWGLLLAAGLSWSMGSELLIDIWQPHALLLPFACYLMLTVGLLDGRWRLLPVWVGVASVIVQTHIGYVYVLAVFGLVVVGAGIVAMRATGASPVEVLHHRWVRWSAVVVGLAWLQPVIEQVAGEGRGNLLRLVTNAGGGDVTIGAPTALKLVAQVVVLPPWWTRFGFADSVESTPLTGPPDDPQLLVPGLPSGVVALLAVAVVLAVLAWLLLHLRRGGHTTAAAATMVSLIGVVAAVATLTMQTVSTVGLGSHQVRWLWALAVFVHISIAWGAVELASARVTTRQVDVGVAAAIALLAVANLPLTAHPVGPTADRAAIDTLERTFDDLGEFEPGGSVRYDVSNVRPFEPWSGAVKMRLRELGIEFTVDDGGMVRQLGTSRRADGTEVTSMRQIERSAALRYDGPGCVISEASPLDAAVEAELDAVIAAAVADLAAGRAQLDLSGLDPDLAARFERSVAGDTDEAFVLVADGVLAFLAADARIVESSPAIDVAVERADELDRRVVGALVLVVDPPVDCL